MERICKTSIKIDRNRDRREALFGFQSKLDFLGKDLTGGKRDHFSVIVVLGFQVQQHGKLERSTGSRGGYLVHVFLVLNQFSQGKNHNKQYTANGASCKVGATGFRAARFPFIIPRAGISLTGIMEKPDIPLDAKTAEQAEMFANRLRKRLRHLGKWARRRGTGAFRLYDRDIPEIPLVLDLYADDLRGSLASGALYKRPYEKDDSQEALWLDAMRVAAAGALGIGKDGVIIKLRQRQQGQAQYEKVSGLGLTREVREGGLKFRVNLSDYLDTGLFLDRRVMRNMVRADSRGKRVLNLFCYTASFSVYAASGGAVSTDSVDLSNTYIAWGRENLALNGFDAEILKREEYFDRERTAADGTHRLIRADVSAFLRDAKSAGIRWDSIVVDPPAFSNSTMARGDFDLQRDFMDLLNSATALLAPVGRIWFSANARSFRGSAGELETALARKFPNIRVTDISDRTVDEDFRGRKTPKAFLLNRP